MSPLLLLHLLSLGIWIGVVAAETVIELDGKKDDPSHIKASKLHFSTDIWIEIPSFTVVLASGLLMLTEEHLSGLFLTKVICGLIAIIANIVCVYGVFVRNKYAQHQNIDGVQSAEAILMAGGVIFIPSFIAAIGLGVYLSFN